MLSSIVWTRGTGRLLGELGELGEAAADELKLTLPLCPLRSTTITAPTWYSQGSQGLADQ